MRSHPRQSPITGGHCPPAAECVAALETIDAPIRHDTRLRTLKRTRLKECRLPVRMTYGLCRVGRLSSEIMGSRARTELVLLGRGCPSTPGSWTGFAYSSASSGPVCGRPARSAPRLVSASSSATIFAVSGRQCPSSPAAIGWGRWYALPHQRCVPNTPQQNTDFSVLAVHDS